MAWWYARFLFDGDRLVDVGVDDPVTPHAEVAEADRRAPPGDEVTSVLVSGYALYGRLRGYYSVGVGRFTLDPEAGRLFGSEEALRHKEPAGCLSAAQRSQVAHWLAAHSPEAWTSSLEKFHRELGWVPTATSQPAA